MYIVCARITLILSRCVVIVAALCQQMLHAERPATYGGVVETQTDVPIRRTAPETTRTPAAKTKTRNFPMPNWLRYEFPDGIFSTPALSLDLFLFLNWLHFLFHHRPHDV